MGSSDEREAIKSYGADIGKRTSSITRVKEWFLVEADRLLVTILLLAVIFLLFLGLSALGFISFVNDDSVTRLAGGMIAGSFSLVTLVVSINQLILSREFTAAGEAEDQLGGVLSFREDVADVVGVPVVPASPTRLLELLAEAIHDRAETLETVLSSRDLGDETQITPYATDVREQAEQIKDTLDADEYNTFRAVSATVGYDDAWQLYAARHIRSQYDEDLPDEARESLDGLIEALELFGVAREHFKTTYLQRELTRFSQLTIYFGVPAILSAMILGFLYGDVGGASISMDYLPLAASALVTVVASPLALLSAFILRTATIARRTSSTGPMVPQKDPGTGPFEVEYGGETESQTPAGSD
ncbi:hypothetical protein ACLI4Z_02890 [Natrialbaceae archaeon A-arb3/5]